MKDEDVQDQAVQDLDVQDCQVCLGRTNFSLCYVILAPNNNLASQVIIMDWFHCEKNDCFAELV